MARSSDRPSFVGRIFSTLTSVERRELPSVVVAFFLFFCVLGGYFAVRPVRETVGTILGRDRVANLWVATWIASLAIVPLYGAIVAKVRRSVFLPLIYGFVAVALAVVGGILQNQPRSVAVGQFFYVFISVLSLFLVSVFWSFLVELFDSGQAKRLFPVIAAGGTAGALVGPLFTDLTARSIGNAGILFVGAALFGLAVALQAILIRLWKSGPEPHRERRRSSSPIAGPRSWWKSIGRSHPGPAFAVPARDCGLCRTAGDSKYLSLFRTTSSGLNDVRRYPDAHECLCAHRLDCAEPHDPGAAFSSPAELLQDSD